MPNAGSASSNGPRTPSTAIRRMRTTWRAIELVRMRDAAERYREEGRAREQRYHERELYEIHLPVALIRQPTAD